jgi:PPOX class probable F420-dependent enzyme
VEARHCVATVKTVDVDRASTVASLDRRLRHLERRTPMTVTANTDLTQLARHHDMLLRTRKRNGTWVATPVNPLVEDDHVFFRTWHTSGKAKRLRNFADVRFAPSTARGRPTGPWLRGRATLLEGDDAAHAATLINHRYPLLQGVGVRLYHRVRRFRTQHYRIDDIALAPGSDEADAEPRPGVPAR